MKNEEFTQLLVDTIQAEERKVREDGQKEYASPESVFHNFDQVGAIVRCEHCGKPIGGKVTLMVYFLKHVFGILNWIGGHRSQREGVTGRIKDARMYLGLLWGMDVEDSERANNQTGVFCPETYSHGPSYQTVQCSRLIDHPGQCHFKGFTCVATMEGRFTYLPNPIDR